MFTQRNPSLDLNGTWKFIPDPMQRCRRQQWWKNRAKPDKLFPCWDPEGMWDIQVPGTWKKQFAELTWYDGHAVYLKEFEAPEIPPGHEAFLVFDGIIYSSEIIVNGHRLCVHEWGYSAFQVRVTEVLLRQNQLFVLVENLLKESRVPGEIYDWSNDGGIVNGVKLIFVPVTHIENFRTSTRLEEADVVIGFDVLLGSRDAKASEEVAIRIPELDVETRVVAKAGAVAKAEIRLPRSKIELWSTESPKLYRTELSTRHETISDEIGYREIRTEGHTILLNGEPVRLYGVSVHSEFPDTGRTATPENLEKLVKAAKDLGLNFLRCAHYPYAEIFGRAMDRAGILWWEEVPAYWLFPMREEKMTNLACGMLEETVRRDWNRASLVIWSVSNECCWRNPENPMEHNYAYWNKAVGLVRALDPSRLISCAEAQNIVSTASSWQPSAGDQFVGVAATSTETARPMHTDEFYQLFDVLAGNLYVNDPGQEAVLYPRFVRLLRSYNKPLMLSEFGSMSLLGAKVPNNELGSEERHATIIEHAYKTFESLPEIVGYAPWVLQDGRAPIHWRWYNQGTGLFRYGFMDENWQPKKAYFTLKDCIARLKKHWG